MYDEFMKGVVHLYTKVMLNIFILFPHSWGNVTQLILVLIPLYADFLV